jgi:hypothetical protein
MQPNPREFHLEEYKQIRAEAVGVMEKVDQYFKYTVLVPTAIYSWLLTSAMGVHNSAVGGTAAASACLKLPQVLIWIAWLIPPVFVLACGLISLAYSTRIIYMGQYLLQLETALGAPILGWERFNNSLQRRLTWARKATWFTVLLVCAASSTVGIIQANRAGVYCTMK